MVMVVVVVVGGLFLLCGFCVVGLLGIGYMGFYSIGSARAFFSPHLFTFPPSLSLVFFCAALVLCYRPWGQIVCNLMDFFSLPFFIYLYFILNFNPISFFCFIFAIPICRGPMGDSEYSRFGTKAACMHGSAVGL